MRSHLQSDLDRATLAVTIFSSSVALVFGVAIYSQLTIPPTAPRMGGPLSRSISPLVSQSAETIRAPANAVISTQRPERSPALTKTVDVKISCQMINQRGAVDIPVLSGSELVRFIGGTCLAPETFDLAFPISSIVNKANGYTATLFYPNDKALITDFMTLDNGNNVVLVTIDYTGTETRTLQINLVRNE